MEAYCEKCRQNTPHIETTIDGARVLNCLWCNSIEIPDTMTVQPVEAIA